MSDEKKKKKVSEYTTIRVKIKTWNMLQRLRTEKGVRATHDDVIVELGQDAGEY